MEPAEAVSMKVAAARPAEAVALRPSEPSPPRNSARIPALRKFDGTSYTQIGAIASAFGIGIAIAFAYGLYNSFDAFLAAPGPEQAMLVTGTGFYVAMVWLCVIVAKRAAAMQLATEDVAQIALKLTQPEDAAAREVARVGRAVRREIDSLNKGLDNAVGRARSLESILDERTSAIERATQDATSRVDLIRNSLREERERLGELALSLHSEADMIAETVSSRVQMVKSAADAAAGDLRAAQGSLDKQIESFKGAAAAAAEGSRIAGREIEREATRFESAAEAALARAESLQQRHERQRGQLLDAVERLKKEGESIEGTLDRQRVNIERLLNMLSTQSAKIDEVATEGGRRVEGLATSFAVRIEQISQIFARETEKAKQAGEIANTTLEEAARAVQISAERARTAIVTESKEAARTLEETATAATGAHTKMNQTLGELKNVANVAFEAVDSAAQRLKRMMSELPGEAGQHAQRIRTLLEQEVSALIALSDRLIESGKEIKTLATPPQPAERIIERVVERQPEPERRIESDRRAPIERRSEPKPQPEEPIQLRGAIYTNGQGGPETDARNWLSFARRLAKGEKKPEEGPGNWRLSSVLAAADKAHTETVTNARLNAMSLRVVETLESLAVDLDRALEDDPPIDLWKRYLAGERSVFARRLVAVLGRDAHDRIAQKYGHDTEFKDYADRYMRQFERLLEEASTNDRDQMLTDTYLTSQTGKLYLILATATGRLS
jgi:hypothetical protein